MNDQTVNQGSDKLQKIWTVTLWELPRRGQI